MAEQFLEDIYQKGIIIEKIKEYIYYTNAGFDRDARAVYNEAASRIERILPGLAAIDGELASVIERTAIKIRDSFNDPCLATAYAEGELIPLLLSYMDNYTGIDVTDGKYNIRSSSTGFLTIRDEEQGITLHSVHDPLWEAYQIANSVFAAKNECYIILGCGLGYLPYQLWHKSEGAVRIIVFEEDSNIIDYAYKYGVLSWIPESLLEIKHTEDIECLATRFVNDSYDKIDTKLPVGVYISPWKIDIYKSSASGMVSIIDANVSLERSMRDRTAVNLWKNRRHNRISFEELKEQLKFDVWIVVSAGPSLDDQIQFLKDSKGRIGIVAVNTVLRRLLNEGIIPDLVVAADQYVQMREHIARIGDLTSEIPLIAEWRLNWQFTELYQGPICFISTDSNKESIGEAEEVWQVSGSVAGIALEAAVRLGGQKVYLVGQDLAYPNGNAYAKGMPYNADARERGKVLVPSVDGGLVPTSEAFDWFRQGLEEQIARYDEVEFINKSAHGAFIKGAKTIEN